MIFKVSPSQIESLDGKQLVELLKKLLHAEAQCSGISLSGVSVPLQITVADGGEDARISWSGGLEQTDYLPSRFCIFQSKATDPEPAGWKKEVWTKNSLGKNKVRNLNEALEKAIAEFGSYIGFTSKPLNGPKHDKRIQSIKEGIREAGANPDQLKSIDIYDANKIADWVCRHPGVAVWFNERNSGLMLRDFQTLEKLGEKVDIASISKVDDELDRFQIGDEDTIKGSDLDNTDNNLVSFKKAKERVIDHLSNVGKFVSIYGSSGIGKTRFVYEIFKDKSTILKTILESTAIYCDCRDIGDRIFHLTHSISEAKTPALMIVDECSHETAIRLYEIVVTEGSNLRILTIGNSSKPIVKDNCLNIFVKPCDDNLIEGIIRQRYPKAEYSDIEFIKI